MSAIAENALIWKLKSVNTITAITSTRIYPRMAPESSTKTPYIVIDRPPGQEITQTISGPSTLTKTPMVIYCIGVSYKESRDLARVVQTAISATGVTGSVQWNSTWVDHLIVSQTYEASEPPKLADEIGYPIEAIDVMMWHMNCDSSG